MTMTKTATGRMLKTTLIASAMMGVLMLPALADPTPPPALTISAMGSASAAPDIAVVTLGVVSEGKTAREALTANAGDMNAVVDTITGAGIDKKDVSTSGLFVEPIYSEPTKATGGRSTIISYRVTNQLTVRIRDIDTSGALLDKVIAAGANRVNGVSFEIGDRKSLADQAIKAAVAEAKRRAALTAEAAGVQLGPIQSLTAGEEGGRPLFAAMAMKADAAMPASSPVMGGTQEINASATIVYTIVPH